MILQCKRHIISWICDLLWQNREQVECDNWLIWHINSVDNLQLSDNQYFQYIKHMLLEEVITEPLRCWIIYRVYQYALCILRQSKLAFHSGFGESNAFPIDLLK